MGRADRRHQHQPSDRIPARRRNTPWLQSARAGGSLLRRLRCGADRGRALPAGRRFSGCPGSGRPSIRRSWLGLTAGQRSQLALRAHSSPQSARSFYRPPRLLGCGGAKRPSADLTSPMLCLYPVALFSWRRSYSLSSPPKRPRRTTSPCEVAGPAPRGGWRPSER